jgi:hypothetical protein
MSSVISPDEDFFRSREEEGFPRIPSSTDSESLEVVYAIAVSKVASRLAPSSSCSCALRKNSWRRRLKPRFLFLGGIGGGDASGPTPGRAPTSKLGPRGFLIVDVSTVRHAARPPDMSTSVENRTLWNDSRRCGAVDDEGGGGAGGGAGAGFGDVELLDIGVADTPSCTVLRPCEGSRLLLSDIENLLKSVLESARHRMKFSWVTHTAYGYEVILVRSNPGARGPKVDR